MDASNVVAFVFLSILAFLVWHDGRLYHGNCILRRRKAELERNLETDPLTGLGNALTMARMRDSMEPANGVVAVLDLDEMKRINDELGHLAGDEVLTEVGNLIRASIRREDVACRWGGDEFVVVFRNQSLGTVERRMRQIEERLWKFRLRSFGIFPLHISWGTAEAFEVPLSAALAAADERMYEMKRKRKAKAQAKAALALGAKG